MTGHGISWCYEKGVFQHLALSVHCVTQSKFLHAHDFMFFSRVAHVTLEYCK